MGGNQRLTAARLLGDPSVVPMRSDALETKRRRTQEIGAEIVLYDRSMEDARSVQRERSLMGTVAGSAMSRAWTA
ncbi:hypothetical protein [Mesorhizobium sp. 1B3]|uniref:hypothetical protein n=1 Tax=Mesorhizobium sp. 1B3 TaxID=3243599 RepID=UPI003D995839